MHCYQREIGFDLVEKHLTNQSFELLANEWHEKLL
jgi:hypothetical protein